MTAALEGGEWSAARPGRTLPPGKTRYPFYRRLGWAPGPVWMGGNLVPIGIRSRTVQLVVSRYTDWATRPTHTHIHTHTHTHTCTRHSMWQESATLNVNKIKGRPKCSDNVLESVHALHKKRSSSIFNSTHILVQRLIKSLRPSTSVRLHAWNDLTVSEQIYPKYDIRWGFKICPHNEVRVTIGQE